MTLSAAVDWKAGDKVHVTTTEYPEGIPYEDEKNMIEYEPHQSETLEVSSVSGATVSFTTAFKFRHFADDVALPGGQSVSLRAHAGLLSRNVVVRGDLTDAPEGTEENWYTGYGAHIVVGEVNYGSEDEVAKLKKAGESLGVTKKLGSLHATNVQFQDMGKLVRRYFDLCAHSFSVW